MKVNVIKHKDVTGKEQLYLKIENENGQVLINIGQKTYDKVNELITEPKKEKK